MHRVLLEYFAIADIDVKTQISFNSKCLFKASEHRQRYKEIKPAPVTWARIVADFVVFIASAAQHRGGSLVHLGPIL